MKRVKEFISIFVISFIVGLLGLSLSGISVSAHHDHQDKVLLCHKTHSETNPWVEQLVNANEVESHLANGDFMVNSDHKCPPSEEPTVTPTPTTVDEDCNEDEVCVTVTPTPTATPSPTEAPCSENCGNPPTFAGSSTNAPSSPTCTITLKAPILQGFEKTSPTSITWSWWASPDPIVSQWIEYGYSKGNYPYAVSVGVSATSFEISGLDGHQKQYWARVGVMDANGCVAYSNDLDP